jgi:hypothetical protein
MQIKDYTAPWVVVELCMEEVRGNGHQWGGGLPNHTVNLLLLEMTLDQTLGNWFHFIKLIHHIKN